MHPAVPYMEREAIVDDVIPLRHPIADKNGSLHSEVFVKRGQVRIRLSPLPPTFHHVHLAAMRSSHGLTCCRVSFACTIAQKIMIPILSVNRLDSVWGDGEVFRPERWMSTEGSQKGAVGSVDDDVITGWSNTMTFSDGQRTCIGWRLGSSFPLVLFSLTLPFHEYLVLINCSLFCLSASCIHTSSPLRVQSHHRHARLQLPIL